MTWYYNLINQNHKVFVFAAKFSFFVPFQSFRVSSKFAINFPFFQLSPFILSHPFLSVRQKTLDPLFQYFSVRIKRIISKIYFLLKNPTFLFVFSITKSTYKTNWKSSKLTSLSKNILQISNIFFLFLSIIFHPFLWRWHSHLFLGLTASQKNYISWNVLWKGLPLSKRHFFPAKISSEINNDIRRKIGKL
jgi:hypothetical protein